MDSQKKFLRKKYIINPAFQYFMLGFALFQSLATVVILYLLNRQFFTRFIGMGKDAGIPDNHLYFQFLHEQQIYFNKAIVTVSLIIAALIVVSVTLISHRIAGPVYRISEHMRKIAEDGEVKDVHFRKGDFFPEIATIFNLMVAKLKKSDQK